MRVPTIIALSGVDGSGKTTAAKLLNVKLHQLGYDSGHIWGGYEGFHYFGLRHGTSRAPVAVVKSPGRLKQSARLKDILANGRTRVPIQLVVVVDHLLQLSRRIRSSARKHAILICDRYILDLTVSTAIQLNSIRLAERICKLAQTLLPRPLITLVLQVDDTMAYARKDDIPSLDQVTRRRLLFEFFAPRLRPVLIEANGSIDNVAEAISMHVLRELAQESL